MALAAILFAGALATAFAVYAPSLHGEFVFDDRGLPMFDTNAMAHALRAWLGVRPLLMATYYLNFHASGFETGAYHAVNVFLHAGCSVLILFAIRRLLVWAAVEEKLRFGAALFGAALFLLHPIQTEAVSYIASRSESLSVLFFLAAFNVFLYRRRVEIDVGTVALILVLYLCAMSCKEHTAMLPAALLLTDYYFNPGFSFRGIRRNWKLYAPIGIAGAAGLLYFASYIRAGSNLGFGMSGLTPYDYLLTESRAIFVYFRLFLLPFGQSVDYDFPISHSLFDHGAVFYGIAILMIAAAAFYYRKRIPLASYGFFLTLLLLAPTSSILPIRDPLAERRLYLPFIGLALVVCALAVRIPWNRRALFASFAAICVCFGVLTYNRNTKWVDMQSLWEDVVSKEPNNARALMGVADSFALHGRCAEAIPYFERAAKLEPGDYRNTYNLASAYDCVNQLAPANAGYKKALALKSTAEAWAHLGMIQIKQGQFDLASHSLDQAQRADPQYILTHIYRGILDLYYSRFDQAETSFQTALNRIPGDPLALRGLDRARRHERQF